jgi:hypothetical protein
MMTHDSAWLGRTHLARHIRLTASLGFLLACVLIAMLPSAALATTPEVRGEWEIVLEGASATIEGTTLIGNVANAQGEFTTDLHAVKFSDGGTGTFSGTLEGGKASATLITDALGPYPAGEFTSNTLTVESTGSSLALSGTGTIMFGGASSPGTFRATRLKTQLQIEEQEARERKEAEERAARENVRGEWALTVESGPNVVKGIATINETANAKNEFASSSALFEGAIPGTFSGTLEEAKAKVTITTEAAGPFPSTTFTSSTITIVSAAKSMSMSGPGTLTASGNEVPATLTATRVKTHQEIKEREKAEQEKAEKEKAEQEKTEKEKAEQEKAEKEKAEKEATEKTEREARVAREAKEKAEKEAAAQKTPPPTPSIATLVSAVVGNSSSQATSGGSISLTLQNPNSYAVQGRLALTFVKDGKPSSAGHKAGKKQTVSLGSASFSLSSNGSSTVKVKLSRGARVELEHHKTLRATLTLTTLATGQTSTTKVLSLTLHAAKPAHGKH